MEDQANIVTDAPETGGETAEIVSAETTTDASQTVADSAESTANLETSQTETALPEWAQKGWGKVNPFLAELTGKSPDEIAKLSLSDRIALAQTTYSEQREKLAELQAEGEFVGIKIDAPADKWDVKAQVENLPAAFKDKLVGSVMNDHLPSFAEQALANPQSHQAEFDILDKVAAFRVEQVFQRPVQEVKSILDLTKGFSPEQLYQALSGGNPEQAYQPINGASQPGVAQGRPSSLVQQAIEQGYQPTDPFVQQLHARDLQFNQLQSQYQQMQNEVTKLSGYQRQQQQTVQQQAVEKAHGAIDGQAEAARRGALEAVTKGRVPESELAEISELVGLAAEKLLSSNVKAKNALELAKAWQADGLEGKAKGQLALYAAATEKAYREAASKILGRLVTQTNGKRQADTTKAARKEIGATATTSTANVKPPAINVTKTPGDYAVQLYEQAQSS